MVRGVMEIRLGHKHRRKVPSSRESKQGDGKEKAKLTSCWTEEWGSHQEKNLKMDQNLIKKKIWTFQSRTNQTLINSIKKNQIKHQDSIETHKTRNY